MPCPAQSTHLSLYASSLCCMQPVVVPSREILSEASALVEVSPHIDLSRGTKVISAFPAALSTYFNKISLTAYKFHSPSDFSSSNSLILVTQLCAILNYCDSSFSKNILANPGNVIFLRHLSNDLIDSRLKLAGKYVDGLSYMHWYKYMRSHLHMGVATQEIGQYTIEFW